MRDYGAISPPGMLGKDAPTAWIDHGGREWKTPTIIGRLKSRIPCHRALREFVIWRDRCCRWCGSQDRLVADHIISRRNGGAHHPDNLQALCESCNASKVGLVDIHHAGGR